jgi:hypothetical protein
MGRATDAIVRGAELKTTADHIVAIADVACLVKHKMGYVSCWEAVIFTAEAKAGPETIL